MRPSMPIPRAFYPAASRRRGGFTAIEMSAVATIIAILVLILIPVLRKRVEETRITAARADMKQIETAQLGAQADTGYYVRLFDLQRIPADTNDDQNTARVKLPKATWNQPFNEGLFNNFRQGWGGPYLVPQRWRTVLDVAQAYPELTRGDTVSGLNPDQGPLLVLAEDDFDERGQGALQRSKYPIDPWGGPYIFFGPGRIGSHGYQIAIQNESNFNTAIVFSMGPNGRPGNVTGAVNSQHYFREIGALGIDDDLFREF